MLLNVDTGDFLSAIIDNLAKYAALFLSPQEHAWAIPLLLRIDPEGLVVCTYEGRKE